jgi:hypothetical protein
MRRLIAALVIGICLHLGFGSPLDAQEPCPDTGSLHFAAGGGCGPVMAAPNRAAMVPGLLDRGSDVVLDLRYMVDRDGTVSASAVMPEGVVAVMTYLDPDRGVYRTFDLGSLDTPSATQANIARLHRWMQTEFPDAETPVEAVAAYLSGVDALKLSTRAELLRMRLPARRNATTTSTSTTEEDVELDPELQQQRDCEQWAVMTLETSDIVWIPMVRTKNDTRVNFINGRRLMDQRLNCWAIPNSPIGTTWHTASCVPGQTFWRTRAESRIYHAAYNDDFNLGASPRHWVQHWIWAQFDHLRNIQGTAWDYRYSGPSGPTFNTSVLGRHDESTC